MAVYIHAIIALVLELQVWFTPTVTQNGNSAGGNTAMDRYVSLMATQDYPSLSTGSRTTPRHHSREDTTNSIDDSAGYI